MSVGAACLGIELPEKLDALSRNLCELDQGFRSVVPPGRSTCEGEPNQLGSRCPRLQFDRGLFRPQSADHLGGGATGVQGAET
jgi:hypothetical protein